MTELMKRYEKDTGCSSTTIWRGEIVVSDKYVEWLEAQLTWRPVSEKPEKDGIYLIRRVDLDAELMLYRGGKWWFFDDELFQYLEFDFDIMANKFKPTHWLPIPPAPEEKV